MKNDKIKKILKMDMRKSRLENLILISLLLVLSFFAWRKLLELVVRADGLIYLIRYFQKSFFDKPYFFTGFELQAMLLGTIFSKIFGPRMVWYYGIELLVMLVINVVFYWLVKTVTKNRWLGFTASLIFSVNYWGLWDIHTHHCYCFFLERVPNVILSLISFRFLHLGLEKSSGKNYLLAVFFYSLSLSLSHFSVLNTAPWLFYPFFWQLFNRRRLADIVRGGLVGLVFLGISGLIILLQGINESGLGPKYGLLEFIFHPAKYFWPDMIIRQLVYWSQYPFVLFRGASTGQLIRQIGVMNAVSTTPLVIFVYIVTGLVIFKRLPKLRSMLLTILFAVPANFLINGFFGQYHVFDHATPNRYLYFPTFWLSIFWAMFLGATFFNKGKFLFVIGVLILSFYYLESYVLIFENFQTVFKYENSTKLVYNYLINLTSRAERNTLIIGPYDEIGPYEATFFSEQLGRNGEVRIMSEYNSSEIGTWQKVAEKSQQVIRLEYDQACECVKENRLK